jgi:4-hydroxy-3-polyprenylbenzoate decarboxylase
MSMGLGMKNPKKRRLIVGISGASGVILGIRALEVLQRIEKIETHLVISSSGKLTIAHETDWDINDVYALADQVHKHKDIGASIASGSFRTMGMIVLPCSIKTLSAVANSYADNLLVRAADVTLKEGRPLILGVRETPLHRGHLLLMNQAAEAGAIIFPPMPAFYTKPQSVDQIIDNLVGRVLERVGIENDLYQDWGL